MATAVANVIPINASTCKLYFRGYDSPDLSAVTQVTFDSTAYDVLDGARTNNHWLLVDTGYSTFGASRVTVDI